MRFTIPDSVQTKIISHAKENPDQEVCGYWLPNGNIIRSKNISEDPFNSFEIDPDFHISMASRYPEAIIYHSHLGESTPSQLSQSDIVHSKSIMMPYLVYHTDFDEWDYFDPRNTHPYPLVDNPYPANSIEHYLGHRWQWERWDCYSLFRNLYKGILGINLDDFSRLGDEGAVLSTEWNQYLDNYESQGFTSIPSDQPIKDWDVMLMSLMGTQIHHALIVVDAANNIGVQITGEGRVSEKVRVTKSHRNRSIVIRHQKLL